MIEFNNIKSYYLSKIPFRAVQEPVGASVSILSVPKFDEFIKFTKAQKVNSSTPMNYDKNDLVIFHYNDTHGNTDSMGGVVMSAMNFKDQYKNVPNFILSAGDNVSGADKNKNGFVMDLMKYLMSVDLSAVGNHEIDGNSDTFYENAVNKNLTFVATNVNLAPDNPLNNFVKKSEILERDGVKYGFVGTMPIDLKTCTKEDVQKGIEVMNPDATIKALQTEIDKLKAQGINRIILLSHNGYEIDKQLVSNLDGIDIVIGGHTHSVVDGVKKGENLLYSKSGEPVLITQAGENGKFYGIVKARFSDNGVLTDVSNDIKQSNIQEKCSQIEYIKDQTIGKSPQIGIITKIDEMPKNRRIAPCAWTCKMADALKEEMNVQIAVINSANTRKVPKKGILTRRDIQETSPMANKLLRTKVTQKQLVDAIQNAARLSMACSTGEPGLLQGSGFTYKIDKKGNLLEMNIVDKNGNISPVDIKNPSDKITYTAVYDSFVAQKEGETPEMFPRFEVEEFDYDKDEIMAQYILKLPNKNNLEITDDKRIQIL